MKTYLVARREELKKRQNKGFTLMEMLIVVAIIAVLIAIAIPVFTSQLEKSREETDVANMRSAKAAAVTAYLTGGAKKDLIKNETSTDDVTGGFTAWFDAQAGKLVAAKPTAYGKGTTSNGGVTDMGYTPTTDTTTLAVKVVVDSSGEATLTWE